MNKIIGWFIKASLVYFTLASALGVAFVTIPELQVFIDKGPGGLIKWVHAHVNLLGWVSMALAAGIYYIVPKLTNRDIHSTGLAATHFWLVNIGLVGMGVLSSYAGWRGGVLFQRGLPESQIYFQFTPLLMLDLLFAFIELAGIIVFVYNIWRSLGKLK